MSYHTIHIHNINRDEIEIALAPRGYGGRYQLKIAHGVRVHFQTLEEIADFANGIADQMKLIADALADADATNEAMASLEDRQVLEDDGTAFNPHGT